ncbi:MAG: CDGSH iron-sulfur domain-containing protein [Alphaproteobacteria bacterium]
MTEKPEIAGSSPAEVDLEKDKTYHFCACGRSQKQPFCDGSHKGTDFKSLPFKAEKPGTAWLCMCKQSKNLPYCDGTHNTLCDV